MSLLSRAAAFTSQRRAFLRLPRSIRLAPSSSSSSSFSFSFSSSSGRASFFPRASFFSTKASGRNDDDDDDKEEAGTKPAAAAAAAPSALQTAAANASGVAAAAAVMTAGFFGAEHLGNALLSLQGISGASSPVSGIPISILLGIGLRNTLGMSNTLLPGLKFATTNILRGGIICVGAKLSALEMASLGVTGIPVVMLSIGAGISVVSWLGPKLGISRKMTSLIAAGTSICGVTAITACAPAIKANQQEVSFAVANVVAFGTLGMLCYPYLAHNILGSSQQIGTFLGLAIHDTSQVMGAALTYNEVFHDEVALKTAAVTKLTRNLFLAGVIPALVVLNKRAEASESIAGETGANNSSSKSGGSSKGGAPMKVTPSKPLLDRVNEYVPLFVLGFIGMSAARSVGDAMLAREMLAYGYFDATAWKDATKLLGNQIGGHYMLGTAMAAVGLSTNLSALKGVGYRPFLLGLIAAGTVGGTAFTSVSVLGALGYM
jgi:uncharacterized integral membrane protein (TIGR00698 family)